MWLRCYSKSTTVLNYCNISTNLIDCIFDTSKEKINKFSPGMHIPIISMDKFKKIILTIVICLPGIIKKKFLIKIKSFIKNGENGYHM